MDAVGRGRRLRGGFVGFLLQPSRIILHFLREKAYDKSEGKHTFVDYCLFSVRREVNKYLIDDYINSGDVYHLFPL